MSHRHHWLTYVLYVVAMLLCLQNMLFCSQSPHCQQAQMSPGQPQLVEVHQHLHYDFNDLAAFLQHAVTLQHWWHSAGNYWHVC